jgi:hypothetical protein
MSALLPMCPNGSKRGVRCEPDALGMQPLRKIEGSFTVYGGEYSHELFPRYCSVDPGSKAVASIN